MAAPVRAVCALALVCWAALSAPRTSWAAQAAAGVAVRGVNPEFASKYTGANGAFTCLDGSRKLPFARVNDDYCDCADGSDEPGTSACYNGRLYCRNLGHEPKLLSTSFVDDGICDCCDGSDEPKGLCKNSCLQQGAEHREALQRELDTFKQALDKKAVHTREAQQKLASYRSRKATIHTEVEEQKALLEKLRLEKDAEEAEQDRQRQESVQAAAESAKLAAEQAQKEAAEAAAGGGEQADAGAEPAADRALHEDAAGEHHEETDEERGRRIASQWTTDPDAAAVPSDEHEVNEEHDHHAYGHDHDHHHEHDHEHDQETPEDPEFVGTDAASRYYAAQRRLGKLEGERDKIERLTTGSWDFGPGDIFLDWVDRCFTSTGARWTYEACTFKDAVQSEGYSNRVTVGRWKGWANAYTEMVFEDGDHCEAIRSGRSFRVKMVCGTTEALTEAEEPATCQYTATLTTPLMCTEADLGRIEARLAALVKAEQDIAAQIAAAEARHDEL